MTRERISAVVSDADVLIDFVKADLEILEMLATRMWDIYIPLEILDEVDGLDVETARTLGLKPYEASVEELIQASTHDATISMNDRLCLTIARCNGWVCFTNDGKLGRACSAEGVTVIRSLKAIGDLYLDGHITRRKVGQVAQALHEVNPDFIKERLVRRFLEGLD